MAKNNLIGLTFGNLNVISFEKIEKKYSRNYYYWKCKCSCGKTVIKETSILKKSFNLSCGCKNLKEIPSIDLTGKVFGKLTVLNFEGYKNYGKNRIRRAYYTVKCSCGSSEFSILGTNLNRKKGNSISCGCAVRESIKNKLHEKKLSVQDSDASMLRLYSIYKSRASKRGYVFNLSIEEFKELTSSNCFYCGVVPLTEIYSKNRNKPYLYNGLDRTNNLKGYILENVKPCCKTCNYAKKDLTENQFFEYINRLCKFNS